jgi:hypothetical protein
MLNQLFSNYLQYHFLTKYEYYKSFYSPPYYITSSLVPQNKIIYELLFWTKSSILPVAATLLNSNNLFVGSLSIDVYEFPEGYRAPSSTYKCNAEASIVISMFLLLSGDKGSPPLKLIVSILFTSAPVSISCNLSFSS